MVMRSLPTIGSRTGMTPHVNNAVVTLSEGSNTVTIPFRAVTSYALDTQTFPVVAGRTYTLRVSVPGGESVEATCTVPEVGPAPVLAIDSTYQSGSMRREYTLRVHWDDPAGAPNYYRVEGEVTREFKREPDNGPVPLPPQRLYWEGNEFIEDQGQDGATLYSPKATLTGMRSDVLTDATLHVQLLHTDEPYYQYHRSIRTASRSEGNPFAEPVLVYSNVTGGLGVFAAYNRTLVERQLE
jgi:hypothetical protein